MSTQPDGPAPGEAQKPIPRPPRGHVVVVPGAKQLGFLGWPALSGPTAREQQGGQAELEDREERADETMGPVSDLVRAHFDFVWRVLRRLGVSSNLADDLTQEVFLVVMRRRGEIRRGRERAFLYAVAVRLAANARRQRRRRREVEDAELFQVAAGETPHEIVERRRAAAELDRVLEELPDKLKRVFVLSDLLELEVGEVAVLEKIPRGTVASRLKRARELFKKKVAQRLLAVGSQRGEEP